MASRKTGKSSVKNFGWLNKPEEVAKVLEVLKPPSFSEAFPQLQGAGASSTILLHNCAIRVMGKDLDAGGQQTGDCTGWAFASAVDLVACVEVLWGQPEVYSWERRASVEWIYGLGREYGGFLRNPVQGCVGAWAVQAVSKGGVVGRHTIGRPYSGVISDRYGNTGVPRKFLLDAGRHRARSVVPIKTYEQARDAISGGRPVTVSSNVGFNGKRDAQGFIKANGSWNHCVLPQTWIAGPIWKRANEISVGDSVYGHDGKSHRVKEVFVNHSVGPLVRIKARGVLSFSLTEEHPVLVYRQIDPLIDNADPECYKIKYKDLQEKIYNPYWIAAKNVREGDYLVTPAIDQSGIITNTPDWSTRGIKKLKPIAPSEDLAWLFGFWIGDGCIRDKHGIQITAGINKPWQRAISILTDIGCEPYLIVKEKYVRLVADSVKLMRFFIEQFGRYGIERSVPEWILSSEWSLSNFLEGLIAADGHKRENGLIVFTSISSLLVHQVRMIAIMLGYNPCMRQLKPSTGYGSNKLMWEVSWKETIKREHIRKHNNMILIPVQTVMLESYVGPVHNFEVEDCNSYIADGIAVHNSMVFVSSRVDGRPGLLIKNHSGLEEHASEPQGPYKIPGSCWWVDPATCTRMLGQGDSWAIGNYEGYPKTAAEVLEILNSISESV